MKRAPVRSTLFNLLFFVTVLAMCVALLPTLILPRKYYMGTVHAFVKTVHFLEKHILGLDYEVRGLEHLPKDGAYIVAAKHQSAYETMKLHLLFKDPAVILKKQLLSIPLWGMYLKKSAPIAIDRSTPDAAIESIKEGAKRVKAEGRPIVIFPQGTRVPVEMSAKQKPYKVGVARIQEATALPIIPMAINAGMFWPKRGWLKSSGRVIFEFLEPIPAGMERSALLAKLEKETEDASQSLMNEAKEKELNSSGTKITIAGLIILILIGFGAYSALWFTAADQIKREYPLALADLAQADSPVQPPEITGYPGKLKLYVAQETLQNDEGSVIVKNLRAEGWPIPNTPIDVTTGAIQVKNFRWDRPLNFDSLFAKLKYDRNTLHVYESALKQGEFALSVEGTADMRQEPIPYLDMEVSLINHADLLQTLAANGVIESRMALFMGAGLTSLANAEGIVVLPLHQKDQMLYAGPLPIVNLPSDEAPRRQAVQPTPAPAPSFVPEVETSAPLTPEPTLEGPDPLLPEPASGQDLDSLPAPSP